MPVGVQRPAAEGARGPAGGDDAERSLSERARPRALDADQQHLLYARRWPVRLLGGVPPLGVVVLVVGVGEWEDLQDDHLVVDVPGQRHRAGAELLGDRLLEWRGVGQLLRSHRGDRPLTTGGADYLVEQAVAQIAFYNGEIVTVEIPAAVELTISDTDPGVQGDRVSGARKPATLQTGKVIQVPLFINPGDRVRVDTRSGEYITRV